MVTPRFELSSFNEDLTAEEIKFVTRCNIVLTGLLVDLLLRVASMPCNAETAALAFEKFSLFGSIASAILMLYFTTFKRSATLSC